MYPSSALPPPTSYGHEHRPLRLTSEPSRPQPQGGCHFQSPSSSGSKCLCQTYQHNRSLQGNTCDCGHSACYHSQTSVERRLSPDRIVGALVEKIRKLEDVVIKERETRNSTLIRERQAWEREIRVLREALAPFYQSESDMRRKLAQLEDRLESDHEEQTRLRERVFAIDDASVTLEKRIGDCEELRCKRKRKDSSHGHAVTGVMSPRSNYTYSSSSAASDVTSVSTQRSPQPPSPVNLSLPTYPMLDSPRSSGVLNLKTGFAPDQVYQRQDNNRNLHVGEEPRSSGFLSIDLAERLRVQKLSTKSSAANETSSRLATKNSHQHKTHTTSTGLSSPPHSKVTTGALTLSDLLTNPRNEAQMRSPKRYKPQKDGMMALEILANATVERQVS